MSNAMSADVFLMSAAHVCQHSYAILCDSGINERTDCRDTIGGIGNVNPNKGDGGKPW